MNDLVAMVMSLITGVVKSSSYILVPPPSYALLFRETGGGVPVADTEDLIPQDFKLL